MYKHIWLTKTNGSARNQEIYEWLMANCSDLFDSITIDNSQSRVSCNIDGSEIFGISTNNDSSKSNVYWKSLSRLSSGNGYFYGIHRITNGILVDCFDYNIPPTSSYDSFKKFIPTVAVIKHENDFCYITTTTNRDTSYKTDRYIALYHNINYQTWIYQIDSYLNGDGTNASRTMPIYYSIVSTNNITLSPMVCTNSDSTPTEIAYWLESSPTRDTGLITINGKEYFSNGIFCILNE